MTQDAANSWEPVDWQYQSRSGEWCNFMNEQHRLNTMADPSWKTRPLYDHPPQAQAGAGDGVKTGTVADYPDDYLLRRAVRHIARKGRRREVAWARVMDVFGLGSTYSAQLCLRFGIDPETGKDSAALEAKP